MFSSLVVRRVALAGAMTAMIFAVLSASVTADCSSTSNPDACAAEQSIEAAAALQVRVAAKTHMVLTAAGEALPQESMAERSAEAGFLDFFEDIVDVASTPFKKVVEISEQAYDATIGHGVNFATDRVNDVLGAVTGGKFQVPAPGLKDFVQYAPGGQVVEVMQGEAPGSAYQRAAREIIIAADLPVPEFPGAIGPGIVQKALQLGTSAASGGAKQNQKTQQGCKTIQGRACVFPFKWGGQSYTGCIDKSGYAGKPWCYSAVTADGSAVADSWGECNADCPNICYTDSEDPCIFPFKYGEGTYSACIEKNHHTAWCYTKMDGDKGIKWANCNANCPKACTAQGASGQDYCALPFKYNGNYYNGCISDGHSQPWCYTSSKEDNWGACGTDCPRACHAKSGKACVFPFKYGNAFYSGCITSNHPEPWCYTNPGAGEWAACEADCPGVCRGKAAHNPFADMFAGVFGSTKPVTKKSVDKLTPCQFPFQYQGKFFNACIKRGDDVRFWCLSETDSVGVGSKWQVCESDCPRVCSTVSGEACLFPMKYEDKFYNGCINKNHNKSWCYTGGGKWSDCDAECPRGD